MRQIGFHCLWECSCSTWFLSHQLWSWLQLTLPPDFARGLEGRCSWLGLQFEGSWISIYCLWGFALGRMWKSWLCSFCVFPLLLVDCTWFLFVFPSYSKLYHLRLFCAPSDSCKLKASLNFKVLQCGCFCYDCWSFDWSSRILAETRRCWNQMGVCLSRLSWSHCELICFFPF